jgi:hypothetical protein
MADGIVGWRFFDAESGVVPEDLSPSILPGGGAGRIVVLASTPFARSGGWANRAVVALAREWAKEDLRIFLMDLGLDSPSLHEELGVQNLEGVSDAFLYGASVQRIAQPALGDTIFFAAAGTAATDPEQILAHPRWNDLAGGFSEADATLLLFLPTGLPGADKIMARATDILFLAGEGESAETHVGAATSKVAAMFGPMSAAGEGPFEAVETPAVESPAVEAPAVEQGSDEGEEPGEIGEEALIGTFGLADELPMGDDIAGGVPDLGGPQGLRLAEGFTEAAGGDETTLASEDSAPDGDYHTDEAAPGDGGQPDFVLSDDFVLETSDGEGALETSGSDFGDQGILAQEIPDFGAEFAQMPGLEQDSGLSDAPESVDPGPLPDQDLLEDPGYGFTPPSEEEEEVKGQGTQESEGAARGGGAEDRRYASNRLRPMSSRRSPPKRKFSLGIIAGVVAGLVILASAVGTAMGAFSVPGFGWLEDMFGEAPLVSPERAGPEPTDPVLRFSLELLSYPEEQRGIAVEMRNTLRIRRPDLIFNLAPQEAGGAVSYVLYAGPATDVVEVENLRIPMSEHFREDPDSWPVMNTPMAFLLGSAGTLAEARRILIGFETSGALGYILQVTYPDGSGGYDVLSGAFEGIDDGLWWQLNLREAGFRDLPLVERRGKPPE